MMGDFRSTLNLPPGFHFRPTDEELVLHFLYPKTSLLPSYSDIIPCLPPLDPWQLHGQALPSENQLYFFIQKILEIQETESGFWKPLDVEEPIFSSGAGVQIGLKKFLIYFIGQPPTATATSWMMQEYHLSNSLLPSASFTDKSNKRNRKLDSGEWVLCRVYQRKESLLSSTEEFHGDYRHDENDDDDDGSDLSCLDEMFLSLEDDDLSLPI